VKKLLLTLFKSLGFIVCILIGYFTGSLLNFDTGLTLCIALLVLSTWFGRHDEHGIYRLFKDTHQSNLDDIQRQQLEEQEAEVIK
jgi:Co/Zn/Cd efflux system component